MAENLRVGNASMLGHDQGARADMRQIEQEHLGFRAWVLGSGLSISSRTTPGSALGTSIATFLLATGGCACAVVLSAVSAPAWGATASLGLPTLIFFGLRRIGHGRQDGQAQDPPSGTLPGNAGVPKPRRPAEPPARDTK
jgi:hypothetical protein